ncbi:MAG: D-2-hydroxyacid dehydrogenase [Saprospiraceae bacterium]|nr:D-2-hydroxyacid dehydrogenase [Saprospiraceae bacterium]
MVRILVNDGIEADGKLLLEEAGYEVNTTKVPQDELMKELPKYDVIIVRSATQVRKDLIDACPNLKIIARGGVGTDNIDVDYARSKGIEIITTPAASSQSVAELAMGHIFMLSRFLHRSNREMSGGDFKKLKSAYAEGIQLKGKTLGIVGFGRIGQELARIALAMGMNVMASDPFIKETDLTIGLYNSKDVKLSVHLRSYPLTEVLKNCDFISLHTPALSKPLIGAEEIAMMKKGAIIVNCARGGVIDEQALLDALESGQLGGAGLDAFKNEPNPRADLLNHPRISVSPHIGASTVEAQANIGLELADKIIAFFGDDK